METTGICQRLARVCCVFVAMALLAACGGPSPSTLLLAQAPNLYTFETGEPYPVARVPEGLRNTRSEVLYVTDRNALIGPDGEITGYGNRRNASMAFGASLVDYGALGSWEELVARTQSAEARGLTRLDPVYLSEIARFPETPLPFEPGGGRLQTTPAAYAAYSGQSDVMRREIGARLRRHGQSRVLVYMHGFNNDFHDGIATLANLWHYAGRQSLPVAYSWPAGNPGVLAYFRDSESGEFSVFHVKEFLRMLASVPEVETIDIVAHSRGNQVMTDALRELMIEMRGGGRDPRRALKMGILVMAAADLDSGVMRQRLVAERFGTAFEQINIYANPEDRALRLSKLIGRVTRVGGRDVDSFSEAELASLARIGTVNTILVTEAGGRLGHAYFRENPAVISDIVLALRSRGLPGSDFRPLERVNDAIWRLHPNYPAEELPVVLDRRRPDR